jgi:uncharacterized protein (UPF0335 family)
MTGPGHNSAGEALRGFVTQLQALQADRDEIGDQMKAVMKEAKSEGFDPKIIRIVLQRRRMSAQEREERDALVETYEREAGGGERSRGGRAPKPPPSTREASA